MAVDCLPQHFHAYSRKQPLSNSDSDMDLNVSPTKLLSMAIRKRRELFEEKDPDLCRELLNKSLIQTLCKQLGEGRVRHSKRSRRHRQSRSRSSSKRRHTNDNDNDDEFEPKRLYVDESVFPNEQGDDSSNNTGDFESSFKDTDQVSMVQTSQPQLDYTQMERYLDSSEKIQFNGYVGHWSSAFEPSTVDHEQDSAEFNQGSNFSLTLLQPMSVPSGSAEPSAVEQENKRPTESNTSLAADIDSNDPLEMNALFRKLYRNSYSIIEPSRG